MAKTEHHTWLELGYGKLGKTTMTEAGGGLAEPMSIRKNDYGQR